jgi:glucose-1-phosphate thymidylyltransferase
LKDVIVLIKKAIVLGAGKGTRLLPLTLAMPKEMIRVGLKPVIEHVIEVLKAGGIKEILIIVGRNKEAIMNYLGSGERLGVKIYYRIQEKPKGSADAVYMGRDFIGSENFVVAYGDNYFKPYSVMADIIKYHETKKSDVTLLVHPVNDPRRFGIVKLDNHERVICIIEKPTIQKAKSYMTNGAFLNIAGLLILKNTIFDFIERTQMGINNELWLTDAVELMRQQNREKIFGYQFKGIRYDIGTFESLLEADKMEQRDKKSRTKRHMSC